MPTEIPTMKIHCRITFPNLVISQSLERYVRLLTYI
jgi:hypothetical protein